MRPLRVAALLLLFCIPGRPRAMAQAAAELTAPTATRVVEPRPGNGRADEREASSAELASDRESRAPRAGVGASCGARTDCPTGWACFASVCRRIVDPGRDFSAGSPPTDDTYGFRGTHGVIGVSLMLGPFSDEGLWGIDAYLAASIRLGVIAGRNELTLELAPFSSVYAFQFPRLRVSANYGILIPVAEFGGGEVSWPLRLGAGVDLGLNGGGPGVEGRADFIGLAIRVDQLVIDLHLPSLRIRAEPWSTVPGLLLHLVGGVGLSHVF